VNVPHCPVTVQLALQFTPPPAESFETVAAIFAVAPGEIVDGTPEMTTETPLTGLTVIVAVTNWLMSAKAVAVNVTMKLLVTVGGAV
jgi:hypothetical protein